MEHLEVVDPKTGMPTGEVLPRHQVLAEERWCRTTNVFILNSKGEVLCHQRSLQKERFPGAWFTHVGGHVGSNESYETNAVKELEEEAGVQVNPEDVISWRLTKKNKPRLWMKDFVVLIDKDASEFTPQEGEVECFAWKSFEEIMESATEEPELWATGVHDFHTEYMCMRSVLTALHGKGHLEVPAKLHAWSDKERWLLAE